MAEKPKDIEAIYNTALKKASEAERAAYLDAVCGDDHVLRARIESLLKAHEEAGDFLEVPAFDPNATLDNSAVIEGPGTRIGRYELLELIGEGGMGLVYLAQQKEPVKRRVALKIVKLGMDTKQVVARFEAERQTLALLEHPNIAHVFDAGTTEAGRPYFVMEYVKGTSITRYCDERKLNIEQRLRLFEQVCEAVHHAHQKGIIHRDIKPSNILVSIHGDKAVPKIIDFGIAKAITQPLTEKTFFTHQGQLLGTPEYMSPEQVDLAIQDIDTRSDIYSLGVVLYELLAGVLPFERESFERAGFEDIQRTIRELEPASPSIRLTSLGEKAKTIAASRGTQVIALARRLHRELEWIPLKAMRKDRCRRYRSASELADDVRNYLNGLPLIAGPETAVYRARKFVRKHAGSVATVALVAVAILLGLVISTAMYFKAEDARQKEMAARAQAEQAKEKETIARTQAEQAEEATKQKAEELRRTLYVNSIQLADAKYREGNIGRVRELLNSCPNDLRGWEWFRLRHISDQSRMTLLGHKTLAFSVAFSPDGKRIISGSYDGEIKVWVPGVDPTAPLTLEGKHKGMAFSPDGNRIVTGGENITIWDAVTGNQVMRINHSGGCLSFSPSGERIISTDSRTDANGIRVWDAITGKELLTLSGHNGTIWSMSYSPDSKRIVSGGEDKTIRIWDAATGAEVMTLRGHGDWPEYPELSPVSSVAFSPDGTQLVSGSYDYTVKIWNVETGAEVMTLEGHSYLVNDVAFGPDGKRFASASSDDTIRVWDAATGSELLTLQGHDGEVISVAFSPDGTRIASGGEDKTIRIWDAATGTEVMTLDGHTDIVSCVTFSRNGQRIVSGSWDGSIKLWDASNGDEVMTFHGHRGKIRAAALSPNGKYIAAGDGSTPAIKIWDATSGVEVKTLRGHRRMVTSVTFNPNGKRIVSGSAFGTVKVWDIGTGAEVMTLRHHERGYVGCIQFSPDGQTIATAGGGSTVKLWKSGSRPAVGGSDQSGESTQKVVD